MIRSPIHVPTWEGFKDEEVWTWDATGSGTLYLVRPGMFFYWNKISMCLTRN